MDTLTRESNYELGDSLLEPECHNLTNMFVKRHLNAMSTLTRAATLGFTNPPDLISNLSLLPASSHIDYLDVLLTPYKAYDPCTFILLDTRVGAATDAISGAFAINDTAGKDGQMWTLDQQAPMGNIKASLQANSAVTYTISSGARVWLVWLACVAILKIGTML